MTGPVRRPLRRAGFTLVEVIVALAVVLILAAVAVPQLAGYLDQKRIEETATQMAEIRDALYKPGTTNTAFYQTVGSNAGALHQLTTAITTSDLDSCQTTFSGAQRGNWPNGGPFLNYIVTTSGIATPIGQTDDVLIRVPANGGGSTGTLRVRWNNTVSLEDAQALDLYVDLTAGSTSGVVQYAAQAGTDMATLYYDIVINGSC
jgi:prepilin-type N-terminal cleavage/methylation domain-containing protein